MSTTPDPSTGDPRAFDPLADEAVAPDVTAPDPLDPTLAGAPLPGESSDLPPLDEPVGLGDPMTGPASTPAADAPTAGPGTVRPGGILHESDLKAFYAAAGAAEALVGVVRSTVTDTSRWASSRLAELRFRRAELAKQAEEVQQRAEGLSEDVQQAPEVAKRRVADLQQQASSTYDGLASRGQRVLRSVRTDVAQRIDPAFDRIQGGVDAARQIIRGRTAPDAAAPQPSPVPETVVVVEDVVVTDVTAAPEQPRTHEV